MILFLLYLSIMPGANCSIFGCGTSRTSTNKGTSIFKIPGTKPYRDNTEEQQSKWRREFLNCVTKDRVIDSVFAEVIKKDHIYVCEKHFSVEDIIRKCYYFYILYSNIFYIHLFIN